MRGILFLLVVVLLASCGSTRFQQRKYTRGVFVRTGKVKKDRQVKHKETDYRADNTALKQDEKYKPQSNSAAVAPELENVNPEIEEPNDQGVLEDAIAEHQQRTKKEYLNGTSQQHLKRNRLKALEEKFTEREKVPNWLFALFVTAGYSAAVMAIVFSQLYGAFTGNPFGIVLLVVGVLAIVFISIVVHKRIFNNKGGSEDRKRKTGTVFMAILAALNYILLTVIVYFFFADLLIKSSLAVLLAALALLAGYFVTWLLYKRKLADGSVWDKQALWLMLGTFLLLCAFFLLFALVIL